MSKFLSSISQRLNERKTPKSSASPSPQDPPRVAGAIEILGLKLAGWVRAFHSSTEALPQVFSVGVQVAGTLQTSKDLSAAATLIQACIDLQSDEASKKVARDLLMSAVEQVLGQDGPTKMKAEMERVHDAAQLLDLRSYIAGNEVTVLEREKEEQALEEMMRSHNLLDHSKAAGWARAFNEQHKDNPELVTRAFKIAAQLVKFPLDKEVVAQSIAKIMHDYRSSADPASTNGKRDIDKPLRGAITQLLSAQDALSINPEIAKEEIILSRLEVPDLKGANPQAIRLLYDANIHAFNFGTQAYITLKSGNKPTDPFPSKDLTTNDLEATRVLIQPLLDTTDKAKQRELLDPALSFHIDVEETVKHLANTQDGLNETQLRNWVGGLRKGNAQSFDLEYSILAAQKVGAEVKTKYWDNLPTKDRASLTSNAKSLSKLAQSILSSDGDKIANESLLKKILIEAYPKHKSDIQSLRFSGMLGHDLSQEEATRVDSAIIQGLSQKKTPALIYADLVKSKDPQLKENGIAGLKLLGMDDQHRAEVLDIACTQLQDTLGGVRNAILTVAPDLTLVERMEGAIKIGPFVANQLIGELVKRAKTIDNLNEIFTAGKIDSPVDQIQAVQANNSTLAKDFGAHKIAEYLSSEIKPQQILDNKKLETSSNQVQSMLEAYHSPLPNTRDSNDDSVAKRAAQQLVREAAFSLEGKTMTWGQRFSYLKEKASLAIESVIGGKGSREKAQKVSDIIKTQGKDIVEALKQHSGGTHTPIRKVGHTQSQGGGRGSGA